MKEIGKIMGMEYPAVSIMALRFEAKVRANKDCRRLVEKLAKGVSKRKLLKMDDSD